MAEGQGFEPWVRRRTLVFKTSAFDHSATPPNFEAQVYRCYFCWQGLFALTVCIPSGYCVFILWLFSANNTFAITWVIRCAFDFTLWQCGGVSNQWFAGFNV